MSRNPFGWSYPAGAENDPNAPWNQVDDDEFVKRREGTCDECGLEEQDLNRERICEKCFQKLQRQEGDE